MLKHRSGLSFLYGLSVWSLVIMCGTAASAATTTIEPGSRGGGFINPTETFFVSRAGDNSDGRTWKTAWNELDQIKWAKLSASKAAKIRIEIDGGSRSMTYNKGLVVSMPKAVEPQTAGASYPYPYPYPGKSIEISRSRQMGHSGQIVIDGQYRLAQAITINEPNTSIKGLGWKGIHIRGFQTMGIRVNAEPATLSGIEIAGASSGVGIARPASPPLQWLPTYGLYAAGYGGSLKADGLIIHDTLHNVRLRGGLQGDLHKCWIYSSNYLLNDEQQSKVSGVTSGYRNEYYVDPLPESGFPDVIANFPTSVNVRDCVVGPGLGRGLVSTNNSRMNVSNCLLINATRANLVKAETPGTIAFNELNARRVTSFMTALNNHGDSHDCIKSTSPSVIPMGTISSAGHAVNGSVFYGGHVRVPSGLKLGVRNTQFKTTGNTLALSSKLVDPKFKYDVASIGPFTPVSRLMNIDFALSNNSPAKGTGSTLTSVKQLLTSPLP